MAMSQEYSGAIEEGLTVRLKVTLLVVVVLAASGAYAQHDGARNALRKVAAERGGREDPSGKEADEKRQPRAWSADMLHVQTIEACYKGNAAVAFELAKQAIDAGLPPQRLQAGPREALKPLHEHGPYREWMKDKAEELLHGPMLGAVTDSSASFWVRTAEEVDITIVLRPVPVESKKSDPLVGDSRTSAEQDFTAVVKVSGLATGKLYRYEILVNGKSVASSEFATYPKQNSSAKFRIAFGGGAGFTPKNERMWNTIASHGPAALLMLGDNVYIDDPEEPVTQRFCYYRRQGQPDWRTLASKTSVYSIYDDHDFGKNDCVPGPEIDQPAWKRTVWKIFKENWNNPSYGGGEKQPGCWYDFYIGDVHFIMLDCRYYRDLEGGSMIGPVQKEWLFDTLKNSKGKFKILASSVPFSKGVKPGSKDTWDGYSAERQEIFKYLADHGIEGVILMAADRHRTDLRMMNPAGCYPLYEVMSSRLTNVHVHKMMDRAKGSRFIMGTTALSFGMLDFDTTAEDPEVKYTMVTIDGAAAKSYTIKLSELSF